MVHVDRLTHFSGETPECWVASDAATDWHAEARIRGHSATGACDFSPLPEVPLLGGTTAPDRAGETPSVTAPAVESRRRHRRPPRHLSEFVCKMEEANPFSRRVCGYCGRSVITRGALRKHLLVDHGESYGTHGQLYRLPEDERVRRVEKLRRSQQSAKRRRRQPPSAAATGTDVGAEPPDPPGSCRCLTSPGEPAAAAPEWPVAALPADLTDWFLAGLAGVDVHAPPSFVERETQASVKQKEKAVGDAEAHVLDVGTDPEFADDGDFLAAFGLQHEDILQSLLEYAGRPAILVAMDLATQHRVPEGERRRSVALVRNAARAQRHLHRELDARGRPLTNYRDITPLVEVEQAQFRVWCCDLVVRDL